MPGAVILTSKGKMPDLTLGPNNVQHRKVSLNDHKIRCQSLISGNTIENKQNKTNIV